MTPSGFIRLESIFSGSSNPVRKQSDNDSIMIRMPDDRIPVPGHDGIAFSLPENTRS